MPGKLFIVPTPIGNLDDMPPRALEALREADAICAEDTRVTGKLLAAFGIEGKRLERLDENILGERAEGIVDRIGVGESIAYCTDAGMPGVSDPGLRLVDAALDACVPVEIIPGPSAVITAYVASGIACPQFYFGGFFPRKDAARRSLLQDLATLEAALIFYESPNRLVDALHVIADVFPLRTVAVCRELTKMHEETVRDLAPEVFHEFAERESIKGEIVIVIGPASADEEQIARANLDDRARARAQELLEEGERPKQVAKMLAEEFALPRNSAYDLVLSLKDSCER